jgi:hypothetical protein
MALYAAITPASLGVPERAHNPASNPHDPSLEFPGFSGQMLAS